MLNLEVGKVLSILYSDNSIQIIKVNTGKIEKAINYLNTNPPCEIGDEIVINTIANRLNLGTGGYNFVYYNLSNNGTYRESNDRHFGHIIKMKYTPMQLRIKPVEEYEEYRDLFDERVKIEPKPVIAATLHSMVPPIVSTVKYLKPDLKISCIYTCGGALNSSYSNVLRQLKSKKLINSVITSGECYGGDFESINIYTAIIFSIKALKSDILIVCCGPGIAGTSTYFGFSTLEFILPVYASKILGCRPIVVPRISFEDKRKRHYGISMQTIALLKCLDFPVNVPICNSENHEILNQQLETYKINDKHNIIFLESSETKKAMEEFCIYADVMGRKYEDDKYYFDNCGVSGVYALSLMDIT